MEDAPFFLFLQSEWVRPIPCFLTATGMDTLTDPQLGTISFVRRARARRIVVRILPDGQVSYCCTVPFGCTGQLTLPHGGGNYELGPGTFAHTYRPTEMF